MAFLFNFCSPISEKCAEESVFAMETLEVLGDLTDTCDVMGRSVEYQVVDINKELPPSIKISYSNGDECLYTDRESDIGKPKKVSFLISCSDSSESEFTMVQPNGADVSRCDMLFSINHKAGCPKGAGGGSTSFLVKLLEWLIVGLILYTIVGFFINVKPKQPESFSISRHFIQKIPDFLIFPNILKFLRFSQSISLVFLYFLII